MTPMMRRLLIATGLALGALLVFWLVGPGAGWIPLRVETARIVRGPAVQAVYATGVVEPVTWAKVSPTVAGRLMEILVRDGDQVTVGQVLARLEQEGICAGLAEAEARERFLHAERERFKALVDKGVASRQAFERIMSEHDQSHAALELARQCISDRTLRAPIDGRVLRQDGEVGETVASGNPLFWVGQAQPLRITAEVDEEDVPLVTIGQSALVKADAFPDRALNGTVSDITLKGDPIAKSYRVRIALPADSPVMVGMTTEVNIIVREASDALLVPVAALSDRRIWVVVDGRARAIPVRVGAVGDTNAEIRSGIDGKETVILAPPEGLEEGRRVVSDGLLAWIFGLAG